jgi:tetratricopeptide (TPR) repeat protein
MSTSEPNKTAPPSPVDPGVGNVSPLGSAFGSRLTLLVHAPGVSKGSQTHLAQPHVHTSPPGIVCPANALPERQRIITDIARQLFTFLNISNSFQDELLAKRIIAMAEVAYSQRRNEELEALGQILELTKQHKFIGAYYRGLAALKLGRGNLDHAKQLLEQAAEFAPLQYRARAILSLGAVEGYRGDVSARLQYHARALQIEQADYYTRIEASRAIALIHSVEGNHRRAVEQLEALHPVARHFARIKPRLYFDLLNSLAVEYAECGRLDAAEAAIRPVILSPLAQSIEEYKQTAAEIAEQQPSRAMVAVALPQAEAEPTDADTPEERPRLPFQHRLASLRRLPPALPSPTLACLLICAPIRAPTVRP